MNEKMEKYLAALAAAVEAKDRKAIELLDAFSSYVYHDIYAMAENTSGEEQAVWMEKLERVKVLITRMSNLKPQIW
jgi:hypothetical protein